MLKEVIVTQDHIDHALPTNRFSWAIALALRDEGCIDVSVSFTKIEFVYKGRAYCLTPSRRLYQWQYKPYTPIKVQVKPRKKAHMRNIKANVW